MTTRHHIATTFGKRKVLLTTFAKGKALLPLLIGGVVGGLGDSHSLPPYHLDRNASLYATMLSIDVSR
jgi:hypothetical protein